MNASALSPLIETIRKHELKADKRLGQHFLLDEQITGKVAAHAGKLEGYNVIEIGPGPGGLTRSLLARGADKLIVVEKDERCIAALQELVAHYPGKLEIIREDALHRTLASLGRAPRKLVSNLPYNVGTQLLMNWLQEIFTGGPSVCESFTLMFQREVAERIAASPNTKDYGRVSVITQWLCEVSHQFDLPPGAFSPPPKVHSSVISVIPRKQPLVAVPMQALERVLASAFGQRRKMLRSSLKSLGVEVETLLGEAGIDGTRRGETLSVEEYCTLAQIYVRMRSL